MESKSEAKKETSFLTSLEPRFPMRRQLSNIPSEVLIPSEEHVNDPKSAFSDMGSIQVSISAPPSSQEENRRSIIRNKKNHNKNDSVKVVAFDNHINEISFPTYRSQELVNQNETIESQTASICSLLEIKFDPETTKVDAFIFEEIIDKISNLLQVHENTNKISKSKQAEIEMLKEENSQLTKNLEKITEDFKTQKMDLSDYRTKNSGFIQQFEDLSMDLGDECENTKDALFLERAHNNELQQEVFNYRNDLIKMKESCEELHLHNSELSIDLENKTKEISELRDNYQYHINLLDDKDQVIVKLEQELTERGKLWERQNDETMQLKKDIEDTRESLELKNAKIDKLNYELESSKTKISTKVEIIQKLERKLKSKVEELKQLKISFQGEKSELKNVIIKLSDKNSTLTAAFSQVDQSLRVTREEKQALSLSNDILSTTCRKIFKINLDIFGVFLQDESSSIYQSLVEQFRSITMFNKDDLALVNRMCKLQFYMLDHLSKEYYLYAKEFGELPNKRRIQC
ncbi:hypothetical protein JA1_003328 [Spathaspora sp. JA1]|nr:hypothetical protein JA1_003328 [Spathaspora sp. JA1]